MKKNLLHLTLFILLAAQAGAQATVYHPFPDSNATWCGGFGSSGGPCVESIVTYTLGDKVMINNKEYSRLLGYDSSTYYNCFPYTYQYTEAGPIYNYIRQDIAFKTVYIYDSSALADKVLYNFNLAVGDTLNASNVYWASLGIPPNYIVTSIDSALIDGSYRRRINYNNGCFMRASDTSMVEGIGSLHGLMVPPSCFEEDARLNEFIQDNKVLYGDTSPGALAMNCHDFLASTNDLKAESVASLFPNPFHLSATLQLSTELKNAELRIYNVLGEEVKSQSITGRSITINRDGLTDGIYFYRIENSAGQSLSGKLITN